MSNKAVDVYLVLVMLATIGQSSCSAVDTAFVPNAKIDVKRVEDSRFPDVYVVNFKVRFMQSGWWREPERTVPAYMKTYNLIPEECGDAIEIIGSGGFENQSWGWARFRCKPT